MIRFVKGIFFQMKKLWFTECLFFLQAQEWCCRGVFIFASHLNSRAKSCRKILVCAGAALACPRLWRQKRLRAKGSTAPRTAGLVPLTRIWVPSTFSTGNRKALRIFSFRKYSQCSPFSFLMFHSAVLLEEVLNFYGSLTKNTANQITPFLSGPSVPQDLICSPALYTPHSHLAQPEYGCFSNSL